jgi:hypothetical protein
VKDVTHPMIEPSSADYTVEETAAGRYEVVRLTTAHRLVFDDEGLAIKYAQEGARYFGVRAYRRTATGWIELTT